MRRYRGKAVWGINLALLGAAAIMGGCVAATAPYGSASIVSEPAGAKVVNLEDGTAVGTTPMKYTLETEDGKAEYIQLLLSAPGYADQTTSFWINPRYGSAAKAEENPQAIKVNLKKAQ